MLKRAHLRCRGRNIPSPQGSGATVAERYKSRYQALTLNEMATLWRHPNLESTNSPRLPVWVGNVIAVAREILMEGTPLSTPELVLEIQRRDYQSFADPNDVGRLSRCGLSMLSQQLTDYATVHVGQAAFDSIMAKRKLLMINAQQMQHRGMYVVAIGRLFAI